MSESGGDSGIHRVIPSKGDSPHKRREKIIVLGTIALVILTVLLLSSRGASTPADDASGDLSGPSGGDGPDTYGDSGYGPVSGNGPGVPPVVTITRGSSAQVKRLRHKVRKERARLGRERQKRMSAQQHARREHKVIKGQRETIHTQNATITRLQHPVNHRGRKNGRHAHDSNPARTHRGF